ncbi:uncharacterized protein EV422DRAFT_203383 [Fimicolochytrium jonesii]|uniref:uncharacterized protein n=1 Tax=Fimicolochytrium jonesii TaxID=1396493 RepID=UPI0022FE91A8|nr:uncharacterized protein EV422DRAFT_203383 [Fimicolochytrium jonesii]KAI8818032.1 hypothetical protein EV422DRAFT_203383 [Fimicolochytrium jonesii]
MSTPPSSPQHISAAPQMPAPMTDWDSPPPRRSLPDRCADALSTIDAIELAALEDHYITSNLTTISHAKPLYHPSQGLFTHWQPEGAVILGSGSDVDTLMFRKYAHTIGRGVAGAELSEREMWDAVERYRGVLEGMEYPAVARCVFEEIEEGWVREQEGLVELGFEIGGRDEEVEVIPIFSAAPPPSAARHKLSYGITTSPQRKAAKDAWVYRLCSKTSSRQTTADRRLAQELREKEAELKAMQERGFHANPVPVSSKEPKYEALMAHRGTKSALMRLKSTKHRRRTHSSSLTPPPKTPTPSSPTPVSPATLRSLATARASGQRRRARVEERSVKLTFHPQINEGMPDYKAGEGKLREKLRERRGERGATTPHPFPGVEDHQARARKHLCTDDSRKPRSRAKEKTAGRSISSRSQAKSRSKTGAGKAPAAEVVLKELKARMNHSYNLKVTHRAEQLESKALIEKMQREENEEKLRQRKSIQSRIRAHIRTQFHQSAALAAQTAQSTRNSKARRAEQEAQYEEYLEGLRRRLDERPCMFEAGVANGKGKDGGASGEEAPALPKDADGNGEKGKKGWNVGAHGRVGRKRGTLGTTA